MIGFVHALYTVYEDTTIPFCVEVVNDANEGCLVNFPFNINLTITGGSAGN